MSKSSPKWLGVGMLVLLLGCAPSSPDLPLDPESLSSRYPGKTLVINYWAEWCTPCRKEIPELNELAIERAADVAVLSINFDQTQGAELERQIRDMGIKTEVLLEDPGPMLGIPRPAVLPTTLIVDPSGLVVSTLVGPQTLQTLSEHIPVLP